MSFDDLRREREGQERERKAAREREERQHKQEFAQWEEKKRRLDELYKLIIQISRLEFSISELAAATGVSFERSDNAYYAEPCYIIELVWNRDHEGYNLIKVRIDIGGTISGPLAKADLASVEWDSPASGGSVRNAERPILDKHREVSGLKPCISINDDVPIQVKLSGSNTRELEETLTQAYRNSRRGYDKPSKPEYKTHEGSV